MQRRLNLKAHLGAAYFDRAAGRGLKKSLHCACGHTVAFHSPQGCAGVTFQSSACPCTASEATVIAEGVRSFHGSRARLRRRVLRLGPAILRRLHR